jgi:hypothetical protein
MSRLAPSLLLLTLAMPAAAFDLPAHCAPLPPSAAAGTALCVQSDPDSGEQRWWQQTGPGDATALPAPQSALSLIAGLAPSPDGRWLAVLSVGEGHPILELFPLPAVLSGTAPAPSFELNPFPGSVDLIGWQGGRLTIASDRLLTLDPLPFGAEPELPRMQPFTLDPEGHRIEPLPPHP